METVILDIYDVWEFRLPSLKSVGLSENDENV